MSDETYEEKFQSLQHYIPFLVNMMGELKAKGNRQAQLEKMKSLHCMITDSSRKLKLETLNKCEEVLKNIYLKVNPQLLTKVVPKPVALLNHEGSTETPKNLTGVEDPKIDTPPRPKNIIKPPNVPATSQVVDARPPNVPTVSSKVVDPRRPLINLDDVQEHVKQKIIDVEYDSKSVHELEEYKKQLHQELHLAEAVYQINKTSDPSNEEKSKSMKEVKSPGSKNVDNKCSKDAAKAIKEFDMFENLPAPREEKNISKKGDRRSSTCSLDSDGKRHKEHREKDRHKHKDKKRDKHGDSRHKSKSVSKDRDSNKHSKEKKHKEALETERSQGIDIQSLKNSAKRFQSTPPVQSSSIDSNKSENAPAYKRLADKFNPKPKTLPIELPDVEKAVSDSIESTMEAFPIRSLINSLGNKNLSSPPKQPKPPVMIPAILQQIVSRISLGAAQNKQPTLPVPRPQPTPPQQNARAPNVIKCLESPLSPPSQQQPTVFHLPRPIPPSPVLEIQPPRFMAPSPTPQILPPRYMAPSPTPQIVPPELLGRSFLPRTGVAATPPASFSQADNGVVNMDLGTPRSDFDTPRTDFGTPRADFVAPRVDFGAQRADFAVPRRDFEYPRHDYDAVMTPRADFNSPPANNYAANQFVGNNQFDFAAENQMHGFNQRGENNFMGPGHFAQQSGNLNAYDLAQNALIQQSALAMSNNYAPYQAPHQAPHGFYPKGNQMQNANYEQPNYFCEQQPLYQERARWPGRNNERGGRPQGPTSYGEYREMRQRHEREAKMAQEQTVIKDPRLKPRETKEEDVKETTETDTRNPRISRGRERFRSSDRATNEEKVESRDPRSTAKPKDSMFDKMYSGYGKKKDDAAFVSPLNSLYNVGEGRTGRGYGVQSFKIPKKYKKEEIIEDQKKTEEKRSSSETRTSGTSVRRSSTSDKQSSSREIRSVSASRSSSSDKQSNNSEKRSISADRSSASDKQASNIINDEQTTISDEQTTTSDEQNICGDKQSNSDDKQTSISDEQNSDKQSNSSDKQSNSNEKPSNSVGRRKRIVSDSDDDVVILNEADRSHAKTVDRNEAHGDAQNLQDSHYYDVTYTGAKVWNAPDKPIIENSFVSEYDLEFQSEIKKDVFEETVADPINEGRASSNEKSKRASASSSKINVVEEGTKSAAKKKQIDEDKSVSSTEATKTKEPEVVSNKASEPSKKVNETAASSPTEIVQIVKDAFETQNNLDQSSKICSLLESVLGKLDSQQMQMVRNILSKEESNKEKTPKSNEESLPTSTTDHHETQVNEVTESVEHSEMDEQSLDGVLDPEPIVVSVGERIKNRKRTSQVAAAVAAQKKKSELDLLHADIQDMFIRDGVLKATGKRRCAHKDDSSALSSSEQPPTKAHSLDESKVIKKRGPKRKLTSVNSEVPIMKQIKVILKKMPDAVLGAASVRSRQTSFAESDVSENVSLDYGASEEESLKEFGETQKPKTRRRKTAKWAAGIISKPKKRKTKSKESSPVRSVASETASLSDLEVNEIPVEPDIDYYYDYTTKGKLTCKLCQYTGHWMTAHYLKEHPESEVLTSRLAPQAAAEAIKDFASNRDTYKNLANKKLLQRKFNYSCRMCGYASLIPPQYFYEHVTTHTGEYRHECGFCEYVAASERSMSGHYLNFHPDKDKSERTAAKRFNFAIVFGYMCSECNFIQLKEKSLEDHVKIYHGNDKSTIHKINMSTILDIERTKEDSSQATIKESQDALPVSKTRASKPTLSDEAVALTHRKKPGPKSKTQPKTKVSVSEATTEQESEAEMPTLRSKSTRAAKAAAHEEATPVRKRRRSPDMLINDDGKEDLDAIITLSSRSSRAAKEKATAKLKSLMESSELSPSKRRSEPPETEIANQELAEEEPVHEDVAPNNATPVKEHVEKEAAKVRRGSSTNTNEMAPPIVDNVSSEKDLNVFTCRSDILQEQAKTIEEDRLRQMDELNKSFASKPKLDFVNKLSNRLNSAQELSEVTVKKEPQEVPPRCETFVMPVFDNQITPSIVKPTTTPAIIEKAVVTEEEPSVQTPSIKFKGNSLYSSTIQKLQGKINEAVQEDTANENTQNGELLPEIADSFISIGDLIRATKIGSEIFYSCHVNDCKFTSKDKTVFKMHCKLSFHKNFYTTSSLCDRCGVIVSITQDTTLLENLYDHLVFAHEDFISPISLVRMRRFSGDKLSIKKEKGSTKMEEPKTKELVPLQDIEAEIDTCVLMTAKTITPEFPTPDNIPPLQMIKGSALTSNEGAPAAPIVEPADDRSYGFKIVEVTSLADCDSSPTATPAKPPVATITKLPPLVLVNQEELAPQSKVIREAKLTILEANRPRKGAKALQSLIETPSNLYKCPHFFCKFSSNVRAMFSFHLKEHTSDSTTMVPCVYCDVKTPWDHVPMHIDIRHAASRHTCGHCLYRAVAPEYVCLHLEQCHSNQQYLVISVPPHKAAKKFSAADMKIDCKQLCEPFRCVCENEHGELKSHEYLFENEFVKHLLKFHKHGLVQCGYRGCTQKLDPTLVLNHWAMFHSVRTYQCSYCKVNSKEIQRMYSHFAQVHPNMMPNILVRKNETSLPKHKEVGFSDEAYQYLGHIRKFPATLMGVIKKRSKYKKIKIIESDASVTAEEPSVALPPPKTSPSNTLLLPIPHNNTQLLLANPNLQLLVASTSTNEKVLVLTSNPLVSQPKIPTVTSTASIGKVSGRASTSPTSKRIAPIGKVVLQTPTGSSTPPNLVPIRVGAQTSTPLKPQAPVRMGGITIYPSDVPEDNTLSLFGNIHTTSLTTAASGNPFYTSAGATACATSTKQSQVANIPEVLPNSSEIRTENDSPILNEDHILQSAIQSILDFGDESNNARLDSLISMLPEHASQNPPPLVLFSNSTPNTSATIQNKESVEVMAPMEHINVDEPQEDPLQFESNEESGTELFISDDHQISEDPLNVLLNSDLLELEAPVTESLDPAMVAPPSAEAVAQNLSALHSSASYVGSTDEESDGSSSEKKTSGLLGYQLFRCAMCNLSFSTFEAYKKHLSTSITCKKAGAKPYQCAHCYKRFKTPQRLAKHIFNHGVLRFFCGLCNEKFNTVENTKMHLKTRHSILQFNMSPLKADKNDMEVDEFMFIPRKENEVATVTPKLSIDSCLIYNPDEIDAIPTRQIFNTNVKCGKCNYQTKVRVNIIRHLQMHLDEKAVPDTAPVNPVPCLEKNEKMFDKMCNLAASSFPTGRMGGPPAVKEKEEDKEKHPEFVPSHRRFVCCAQGCSYLCPEESNLKHHIMALHSDEANFTCAHCKVAIDSSEVENVIKHFKFHGLHLYKCQYCSFVHHLKHKVEKHISDGHLDSAVKVITVRYMDSEPEFTTEHHDEVTPQPVVATAKFKPWSCCMCKSKYHAKDEILMHIVKKHNIDAQYRCTLCAFKDDQESVCRDHFKEKHPDNVFDIILVYREQLEEEPQEDLSLTPFDTTPLWQRDKPRVRHIRGILFDESSSQPTKSPKKKGPPKPNTALKTTPVASTSSAKSTPSPLPVVRSIANRNLFECIDAVARGTAETLKDKCSTYTDQDNPGPSGITNAKTTSAPVSHDNSSTSSDDASLVSTAKVQNKPATKIPPITLVSKDKSRQKPSIKPDVPSSQPAPVILNKFFSNPTNPDDTLKLNLSLDEIIHGALDRKSTTSIPNQDATRIDSTDESDDVVIISPPIPNITVIDSDDSDVENDSSPVELVEEQDSNLEDTPSTVRDQKLPGATDLLHEAVKMAKIDEMDDAVVANGCSRENLVYLFGAIGKPNNKQLKCPRCSTFRSKKAADFIFHLYQEFNFHRYKCKGCDYSSVTNKFMLDHLKMHHPDTKLELSQPLPPNVQLDTWIQMVIREQSKEILELSHELFQKRPFSGTSNIKCYFCNDTFISVSECNEHMFYHWVLMPYQCQHCPHEFYTVHDLRHHHSVEHPDLILYTNPKGPTLDQALASIENTKKKVLKTYSASDQKKTRLEQSKGKKPITSGTVINTPKLKQLATSLDDNNDSLAAANSEGISDGGDDVFACEICAYYGNSEINIKHHLQKNHQIFINKFHILSKSNSETESSSKMACNVCDEIFTELKLRQHFLENHEATFVPYKYKCLSCNRKFGQVGALKVHCGKSHPLSRPSYECVITKNTFAFDHLTTKSKSLSKFSCSLCNFCSVAQTAQYIRSHVKGHFRPAVCNICSKSFRNHYEVIKHSDKVHKGEEPNYSISSIINRECNKVITDICQTAVPVDEASNVLSTSKAKNTSSTKKHCAKKSTASQSNSRIVADQEEGYSFYGVPEPEVDLSAMATFELSSLEYTTTIEEMRKMVNLDVYVDMSDCVVDVNNAAESS